MVKDNKQFNTYKEGLDLEFLREYCMEHGERRTFERGEVRIISGRELQALFDSDPKMMLHNVRILKNLFKMVYGRDLDHYRYTARSRYRRLIDRCPQVVQMLSLKDIASFLNITPSYLSTLRKEMTYETRAEGKRACTMPRKKE